VLFQDTNKNTNKFFMLGFFFESVLVLSIPQQLDASMQGVPQFDAPFAIKGGSQFETPFGRTALETEHKLNTGAGVKPCVMRLGACRRSKLNTNRTQTEQLPNPFYATANATGKPPPSA